jgi:hypothetical protein
MTTVFPRNAAVAIGNHLVSDADFLDKVLLVPNRAYDLSVPAGVVDQVLG